MSMRSEEVLHNRLTPLQDLHRARVSRQGLSAHNQPFSPHRQCQGIVQSVVAICD